MHDEQSTTVRAIGGLKLSPTSLLIAIMAILLFLATLTTSYLFYRTAFSKEKLRLSLVAQSQACLIEAMASFNEHHSGDYPGGSIEATLGQIREAQEKLEAFGETGEFTLATLDGDEIVYLLKHHHHKQGDPEFAKVRMGSGVAEPMELALLGESGAMIGRDYAGDLVLAAYEPVRGLGMGIVAKIDVDEIRAPYIRIGIISSMLAFLLAIFGSLRFMAIANPLARRLKENEERYCHLVAQMGEGLTITKGDETISFTNPAVENIFGVETGTLVGRNLAEFLDDEGLEVVKSQTELRRIGETSTYEVRIYRPDGEWRDLIVTVSPGFDDEGNYSHAIGILRDITEQKHAAEALKESEERYRDVVESMHGVTWDFDPKTESFTYMDPQVEQMFGYPIEEWEDFDDWVAKMHPGDSESTANECLTKTANLLSHTLEYRAIHQNGNVVWIHEVVSLKIENGEVKKIRGIFFDITDRKEAEVELRKLSRAIEQAQSTVVITDSNGIIEYVNPQFTRSSGFTAQEALGQNPRILKSGKHPPEFYTEMWAVLTAGKVWSGNIINKRKNGELFWESAVISPVLDDAGNTTHFVAVKEDITERKRAEEALKESKQKLRAIFDQTFQFIGVLTIDGTLIDANKTSISFAGVDESDIIGKPFWETPWWTHSSKEQLRLREAIKSAAAGEFVRFETTHLSPSGDLRVIDFSLKPVRDDLGQIIMLIPEGRDITEQKRAEQALQAAREIMEASPVVAFIWENKEGWPTIFVSDNVIRVFEYSAEEFLTGKVSYAEIIHPDDLLQVANEVEDASQNASLNSFTHAPYRIITKSGKIKWLEDSSTVIRDPDGKATQFRCTVRDITVHRQAEDALIASETRKRTIMSTMSEGFWLWDTQKRNLEVNPEMCRILGREEYEILGRKIYDFVDEENEQKLKKQYNLHTEGGSNTFDISLSQPDGTQVPCLIHATPLMDLEGVQIGSFAMVTDMTEVKKQSEKNRLMALFGKHNPEPVLRFDSAGKVLMGNPAAVQFFGMEDIVGLSLSQLIPEIAIENLVGLNASGKEKLLTTTINGRVMTFTIQGIPDLDVGHAYGADITELVNARRRAEEANQAKGRFIANMSHELRTPLSIIMGSVEILMENTFGPLNKKQQKFGQSISDSSDHLMSIINDLLDLAKIEAGKLEITKTTIDLAQVINTSCEMIKERVRSKGLKLRRVGLSEAVMYPGDSLRLRQVILNLLANALKFTDDGTITAYLQRSETELALGVKDTGPGIEPNFLASLFAPFEQGQRSLSSDQKGTGLGLTLSREIVRAHGGDIKVESEIGVGSNFIIVLPILPVKEG